MRSTDASPTITFVKKKARDAIEPKTMPRFTKDGTNRIKDNIHKNEIALQYLNNNVTQHATLSQNKCSEVKTQHHIKPYKHQTGQPSDMQQFKKRVLGPFK